jgi:ABC-type uncharacterized transport system ATPase subunit
VLADVSFDIFEGITGILSENGAGKSTGIKIFLGLVKATVLRRARRAARMPPVDRLDPYNPSVGIYRVKR